MAFPGGRRFNRPGDDCQLERGGIGGCCSWDDCQLGERRVHCVVAVLCTMLLLDVIATILGQGIGSDSFVSVASGDGVFWLLSDWKAMPIERLQVVGWQVWFAVGTIHVCGIGHSFGVATTATLCNNRNMLHALYDGCLSVEVGHPSKGVRFIGHQRYQADVQGLH